MASVTGLLAFGVEVDDVAVAAANNADCCVEAVVCCCMGTRADERLVTATGGADMAPPAAAAAAAAFKFAITCAVLAGIKVLLAAPLPTVIELMSAVCVSMG